MNTTFIYQTFINPFVDIALTFSNSSFKPFLLEVSFLVHCQNLSFLRN